MMLLVFMEENVRYVHSLVAFTVFVFVVEYRDTLVLSSVYREYFDRQKYCDMKVAHCMNHFSRISLTVGPHAGLE